MNASAAKTAKSKHGVRHKFFNSQRRTAYQEIKVEVLRIAGNGTRQGFKFAERLFKALPEFRNV